MRVTTVAASIRRRQRGASLVEILVSIVIAAIGLLGIAGLQARSLSMQLDSETRRVAAALVAQLRERVSANQEGYALALGTGYRRTLNAGDPVVVPSCANADACHAVDEVPAVQLALWLTEVRRQLPEAAVEVGPTAAGVTTSMTVTIGWLEPNATTVASDGACDRIASVRTNASYRCLTATFFPG